MYNNQYEKYMRNSLGYCGMPMMNMNTINEMHESENSFSCNQAVDDMYPEIYKIIYPMVCKVCMAVNENISEDLVSRIVNETYENVENVEVVQETRKNNPLLRDLIRILVLRELLGNPERPPRPPFRPPLMGGIGPEPRMPYIF